MKENVTDLDTYMLFQMYMRPFFFSALRHSDASYDTYNLNNIKNCHLRSEHTASHQKDLWDRI